MTDLGAKYNDHIVVSCQLPADNRRMQNPQNLQNTQAALRAAFGPGFQAGGPSDQTLRVVAKQQRS